jgi:capsular polysaccharide export protein
MVGHYCCVGFARWKHAWVPAFLKQQPGDVVTFYPDAGQHPLPVDENSIWVVWGRQYSQRLAQAARAANVPFWRMEDGFLRSIGLGARHVPAWSLVVDTQGMYYDATCPSDLETLLQEAASAFSSELLQRAARLRLAWQAARLSKYQVGRRQSGLELPGKRPGQPVVLVPGQVETDAAVASATSPICQTNAQLLMLARARFPDAYLVYKPHPDVSTLGYPGGLATGFVRRWAQHTERRADITTCLATCDHVVTMTSLVGFEALLWEKPVTTLGLPFYAGWGLTSDAFTCLRRRRTLSLDALVAAALLVYPRYASPDTGQRLSAEAVVAALGNNSQMGRMKALPWVLNGF